MVKKVVNIHGQEYTGYGETEAEAFEVVMEAFGQEVMTKLEELEEDMKWMADDVITLRKAVKK